MPAAKTAEELGVPTGVARALFPVGVTVGGDGGDEEDDDVASDDPLNVYDG